MLVKTILREIYAVEENLKKKNEEGQINVGLVEAEYVCQWLME